MTRLSRKRQRETNQAPVHGPFKTSAARRRLHTFSTVTRLPFSVHDRVRGIYDTQIVAGQQQSALPRILTGGKPVMWIPADPEPTTCPLLWCHEDAGGGVACCWFHPVMAPSQCHDNPTMDRQHWQPVGPFPTAQHHHCLIFLTKQLAIFFQIKYLGIHSYYVRKEQKKGHQLETHYWKSTCANWD